MESSLSFSCELGNFPGLAGDLITEGVRPMHRRISLIPLLSLMSLLAQDGAVPTDSRGWVNKGVQEYKSAKYQDATQSFQRAVDLDPNNTVARLYLATSLMSQYIPGA